MMHMKRIVWNANLTHCKRGHLFNEENTYLTPRGRRQCRICQHARTVTPEQKVLQAEYRKRNWAKLSEEKKAWYKANRAKARANSLSNYALNRAIRIVNNVCRIAGITPEEYKKALADQGGVCAICRQPETAPVGLGKHSRIKNLSIDHDHQTKVFRGLLCTRCNQGLGYFRDDPDLLVAAIRYLSSARSKHEINSLEQSASWSQIPAGTLSVLV